MSDMKTIRMVEEVFRQNAGDMAPVLALVAHHFPGMPLRFACMPLASRKFVHSWWADEDKRPEGFSAVDPDTLKFSYTEQFWERRRHDFTWDYSFNGFNVKTLFAADAQCMPDMAYEGRDSRGWPSPEEMTLYVWHFYIDGKYLYPVASLYDGFPQRVAGKLTLDEWAAAHWINPRYITANPMEIAELAAKISAAGGEVYDRWWDIERPAGGDLRMSGMQLWGREVLYDTPLPAHVTKYLDHSPDLVSLVKSGDSLVRMLERRLSEDEALDHDPVVTGPAASAFELVQEEEERPPEFKVTTREAFGLAETFGLDPDTEVTFTMAMPPLLPEGTRVTTKKDRRGALHDLLNDDDLENWAPAEEPPVDPTNTLEDLFDGLQGEEDEH